MVWSVHDLDGAPTSVLTGTSAVIAPVDTRKQRPRRMAACDGGCLMAELRGWSDGQRRRGLRTAELTNCNASLASCSQPRPRRAGMSSIPSSSPVVPWVKARADAGHDELVDPLCRELHDQFAVAEHGEDLAPHPKPRIRPEPGPWRTVGSTRKQTASCLNSSSAARVSLSVTMPGSFLLALVVLGHGQQRRPVPPAARRSPNRRRVALLSTAAECGPLGGARVLGLVATLLLSR